MLQQLLLGVRIVAAVVNGCIPLIIQPWKNQTVPQAFDAMDLGPVLDYKRFTVRYSLAEVEDSKLEERLRTIINKKEELHRLQKGLADVHRSFIWDIALNTTDSAFAQTIRSLARRAQLLGFGGLREAVEAKGQWSAATDAEDKLPIDSSETLTTIQTANSAMHCEDGCGEFGRCHLDTSQCTCLPGWESETCEERLVPACEEKGQADTLGCTELMTHNVLPCGCLERCSIVLANKGLEWLIKDNDICYDKYDGRINGSHTETRWFAVSRPYEVKL